MRLRPRRLFVYMFITFIVYIFYKLFESDLRISYFDDYELNEQYSGIVRHFKYGKKAEITRENVVDELIKKYSLDWSIPLKELPWKIAQGWVSLRYVHPVDTPELGSVLHALTSRKIISADVGHRGTQLKLLLTLEGNQKAAFKPKWFARDHVIEGLPYSGEDRHNGEIAAFHLGRLLEFRRTPLAVGRYINLEKEILPVATSQLLKTFYKRGNNTCFYGKCYYCKGEHSGLCADGEVMEGTMVLWLPETIPLRLYKHPWARTYVDGKLAQWEKNMSYCHNVVLKSPRFNKGTLLLDILDTTVFDYLIGNADRHHYETLGNATDATMLILDNAKSFGNPYHDEHSILAPLYQCCRIRESTWLQLLVLKDGILGEVLKIMLSQDPISPILTDLHLQALNRRVTHLLDTVKTCIEMYGAQNVTIKS